MVRAILSEYDPRSRLIRFDRPLDGLVNRVFLLITTCGDLVLRVVDDRSSDWKLRKDIAIFDHMRRLGLPVPRVLRVDTSRQVIPLGYSLSERLPGEPYSQVFACLTGTDNARISGQLGDLLGRLHSTTFQRFGDVFATEDGLDIGPVHELRPRPDGQSPGPFSAWSELHAAFVEARLRFMVGTGFDDLVEPAQAWFDANWTLLDVHVTPRLLHMDLHRGNILIREGEISGILDIEESIVGHNEYDLMRTELAHLRGQDPAFADAFFTAYGRHVRLDEGYEDRRQFYDASRTLVWITSLIRYGNGYVRGSQDQSCLAARKHLRTLLGDFG